MHGDVDAFTGELRLISQTEEIIRAAPCAGREGDVPGRSGLNKVVGDNEGS